MPITAISSICHFVSDWSAAKAFYTEALGLELTAFDDSAGWAALSAGERCPPFFLVRRAKSAGKAGGALVGFDVTGAEEVFERIKAGGGRISAETQVGCGVRVFTVYDPDGNAFELSEAAGNE